MVADGQSGASEPPAKKAKTEAEPYRPAYALARTLEGHEHGVVSVKFSPDGKLLASASADKTIKLWDPETGKLIQTLHGHKQVDCGSLRPLVCMYFVVEGYLGRLRSRAHPLIPRCMVTCRSSQCACTAIKTQGISDVCWDSRSKYLCSASDDRTLKLWEAATGECLRTLEGHTNYVFCCKFNPDGNMLVGPLGSLLTAQQMPNRAVPIIK